MKKRPILFNGEMVRAILDGRKTQTRRVMKVPPKMVDGVGIVYESDKCPYGQAGDRLWVRETWGTNPGNEHVKPSDFVHNGAHIYYKADDIKMNWQVERWRPSIHMPRWASRITLEVTNVRVERVQDISARDIRAEGIDLTISEKNTVHAYHVKSYLQSHFRRLWDSINAKRGYSWDSNPWVWVVEFKVIDQD